MQNKSRQKRKKKAETRKKKALTGIKVQNEKRFTSQAGEQNTGGKKTTLETETDAQTKHNKL